MFLKSAEEQDQVWKENWYSRYRALLLIRMHFLATFEKREEAWQVYAKRLCICEQILKQILGNI